jgi:hypothetical protein
MRDKMIRNRRKSGDSVGASVDTHLEEVVVPLEVTFTEQLVEGEILPDLRTVLRILQRLLAVAVRQLVGAGERHRDEIDNDIRLRQRRDELVGFLGTKVSRFRNTLDGVFGAGSAIQLAGLGGRTEQEPMALLAQVEDILRRFANPTTELGSPGFGLQLDPTTVVGEFQGEYQELRDLLSELQSENRRSDATVIAKQAAMEDYDKQFRWIAGCLESLYHLAGQHELAERVKPSTRRSGRTQADVEAEDPEATGEQNPGEKPGTGEPEIQV